MAPGVQLSLELDATGIENNRKAREKNIYRNSMEWMIEFPEVLDEKGNLLGFDVVIGNPPYISSLEAKKILNENVRNLYKNKYLSAHGTYDMYVIFMELGFNLLASNGILSFITPSKYLSAEYAIALRTLITNKYSLETISDFSDIRVFEAAGVSTMISLFKKTTQTEMIEAKTYKSLSELSFVDIHDKKLLTFFPSNIWGPLLSNSIDLFIKIYNQSSIINNHAEVNACSTASEASIYEGNLTETPTENAFKYINNGTINRYIQLWGQKTIKANDMLYPYLNYAFMNQRRKDLFSKEKLIFVKLSKCPQVYLDESGEFASANTNMVYDLNDYSYKFILGYLNSKLFDYAYRTMFKGLTMLGTVQMQAPQIKKSLLPKTEIATTDKQQPIIDLVNQILEYKKQDPQADTEALEREIDMRVYKLYGLTLEEAQIIDESITAEEFDKY